MSVQVMVFEKQPEVQSFRPEACVYQASDCPAADKFEYVIDSLSVCCRP